MSLEDVERRTKAYAEVRAQLADKVRALQDEIEAAKRRRLKGIKAALAVAAASEWALRQEIEANADGFTHPKTQIFHGVRVGFMKAKGKLEWDDENQVLARIERHFPDLAETLLFIQRRPSKVALATLPATDLKKLGVTVIEAGDQVVIRPTDTEVDKLVDALLKDAVEEAQE